MRKFKTTSKKKVPVCIKKMDTVGRDGLKNHLCVSCKCISPIKETLK